MSLPYFGNDYSAQDQLTQKLEELEKEICAITQNNFDDIEEPVLLNKHLYEFEDLKKWITEKETDPLSRAPCTLDDVKRIKE